MKKYILSLILIGIVLIGVVSAIIYFSEEPILESTIEQNTKLNNGSVLDDVSVVDNKEDYDFLFDEIEFSVEEDLKCILITMEETGKQYKALADKSGNIVIFDYNSYLKDMYGKTFESEFTKILNDGKTKNNSLDITSSELSYKITVDFKLRTDLFNDDKSLYILEEVKDLSASEVYNLWNTEEHCSLKFYPIINIEISGKRGDFSAWDIDVDLTHLVFSLGTLNNKTNRPFGINVSFEEGTEDDCCVIDYSIGKIDTFYTSDVLKPWLNMGVEE